MEFVIVTGLSGAGKSGCINVMEDIGFYCVDNMPPLLISKFVEILLTSQEKHERVAIVTDIRAGTNFTPIFKSIDELNGRGLNCKLLFIDASDDVPVRRYKETRRRHPLMNGDSSSVNEAVLTERELLMPLRKKADYVIDTTYTSASQLKQRIVDLFLENEKSGMHITCVSFGFKHGLPSDADLVFDVRCLKNPYYVEKLKRKTGLDTEVLDYVMDSDETREYLAKLTDLLDFTIPLYCKEGKSQLMIACGCTGGKHRSVVFAQQLYNHLKALEYNVGVQHRDILK